MRKDKTDSIHATLLKGLDRDETLLQDIAFPSWNLSLPLLSVCTESLKAWDRPTIPHRQLKLGFFLIPPSKQQQEVSQPWREEHNGSAWLSKLQIQMPSSFRLSMNHKYHPNMQKTSVSASAVITVYIINEHNSSQLVTNKGEISKHNGKHPILLIQ